MSAKKPRADTDPVYRRFQFCAGHRVYGHESKCAHLHGHNYVAHVWAAAGRLDGLGRVIDFGVLKDVVGRWIEENWDHGLVLWVNDEEALNASRHVAGQKVYRMATNPTAENMASELLARANALLGPLNVRCVRVVLAETENCGAEATWT